MQKILSLIKQGENQTVEFKTSFQKEVIISVVAFANTKGGKIFIGVGGRTDGYWEVLDAK
jgi:ATP-dependent DNA helicase RecG